MSSLTQRERKKEMFGIWTNSNELVDMLTQDCKEARKYGDEEFMKDNVRALGYYEIITPKQERTLRRLVDSGDEL